MCLKTLETHCLLRPKSFTQASCFVVLFKLSLLQQFSYLICQFLRYVLVFQSSDVFCSYISVNFYCMHSVINIILMIWCVIYKDSLLVKLLMEFIFINMNVKFFIHSICLFSLTHCYLISFLLVVTIWYFFAWCFILNHFIVMNSQIKISHS